MKLPLLTPKELRSLEGLKEDRELFLRLSEEMEAGILFFEAAIDDENWSREHKDFLDQYIKWITRLYYTDELDPQISQKFYEICLKYPLKVAPFLVKDMEVKVSNRILKTNSIIAGHSSLFLRDQIRKASETGIKEIRLPEPHLMLAEYLFDSNRDLTGLGYEKLISIAISSHELGIDEIAIEAEKLASRFLSEENVIDTLKESHRLNLIYLQKLSADFYNGLNKGLSLLSKGRELVAIFKDLKVLTTFEQYKKLVSITSGIGFRGDLGKDPDISSFIRLHPKIKILDLSETTAPIPLEGISEKLGTLILNRCEWLNADALENLAKRFPHIRRLELEDVNYLSYEAHAAISLFSEVEELNLNGTRLDDEEFELIISEMSNLSVLLLRGLKKLTPKSIEKAIGALNLTEIDLASTSADDALITFIINKMRKLERLNIQDTLVTASWIEKLRKRTKVQIIDSSVMRPV